MQMAFIDGNMEADLFAMERPRNLEETGGYREELRAWNGVSSKWRKAAPTSVDGASQLSSWRIGLISGLIISAALRMERITGVNLRRLAGCRAGRLGKGCRGR
jgi:hypothetical protein